MELLLKMLKTDLFVCAFLHGSEVDHVDVAGEVDVDGLVGPGKGGGGSGRGIRPYQPEQRVDQRVSDGQGQQGRVRRSRVGSFILR